MSSAEIVPFGKYKGQPVEVMAADVDYCEWLTAQPWFKDRYLTIYNTVINYGAEPQDSPEHNQMQARFLDEDWCRSLALHLHGSLASDEVQGLRFEDQWGWDVCYRINITLVFEDGSTGTTYDTVHVECKPDLGDDYPAVLRQVNGYKERQRVRSYFAGTVCVLVRRYAFEHVTWDQVRKIFRASGVQLLAESEVGMAGEPVIGPKVIPVDPWSAS